ncbi:MAG: pirin family protein [Halobacteriovoraceae bacterium]|nr:pirin family protein [Halobacteriovoraceae bacterium]MCB9095291.1 pirin family protein [Halobacteriovoraceae bacterium]
MIKIRKSEDRGRANFGWLNARYTFSFARYYDPAFTGFSDLLVMNEDRIEPDSGFSPHPHEDMEIITYIIEGQLEHGDSIGNKGIIQKGEIQRMSAGKGIVHSEVNPSKTDQTHLIQIWIQTANRGIDPDYESVIFEKKPGLKLLVSPDGEEGVAKINQDFYMHGLNLDNGELCEFRVNSGRKIWIQMIEGAIDLNGISLETGDGAAIDEVDLLKIKSHQKSEMIILDLR